MRFSVRFIASSIALAAFMACPRGIEAQATTRKEIRDSELRLEQIRVEKQKLEQEMAALKTRMRDASKELTNIEKQRIAQSGALRELDFQAEVLNESVEATSSQRSQTQARLIEQQVALNQRLRAIYKGGSLHTVSVLLTAENFGKLLSRYKYLRMIALYERMLVEEVSKLENALTLQEQEMRENQAQLERLRAQKEEEVRQLEQIENQRERAMQQYQQRTRIAQSKIDELAKDEASVSNALAALERRRGDEEARAPGGRPAEATLTTRDLGALNWPVEGDLVFKFGPERKPNGVVLRRHGVGIGAAAGSPVKAVEAGNVEFAAAMEGNGLSVVIGHGAGAYTLYLRLKRLNVKEGQKVTAGQVIGYVGGEGTEFGPHVEFQVRMRNTTSKQLEPLDPLSWLRSRR